MWFDDDSYAPHGDPGWWDRAAAHWASRPSDCVQTGVLHKIRQRGLQFDGIRQQPWYRGKTVSSGSLFTFVTGGWWIADRGFLRRWDYPFPALHHNGGDSILGELIRQQNQVMLPAGSLAACGCESCVSRAVAPRLPVVHVNVGGRKGRRGLGVSNERYVWEDGRVPADLQHQNFELRVVRRWPSR